MSRASLCALVLLALGPLSAGAQFSTVVQPPPDARPPAADTARVVADTDTLPPPQIASMQAWVDSVAQLAVDDELDLEGRPGVVVEESQDAVVEPTTRFSDGAPAPDTATTLPLVTLVGLFAVGAGAALLFRTRA